MSIREPIVQFPASLASLLITALALGIGKVWGKVRYYRELARRLEAKRGSKHSTTEGD